MMLALDANESALRNYMRQQDNDERRIKMIADRVVDLMACGEYAHDTGNNIQEALSEMPAAECDALGRAARQGATALGNAMLSVSFQYWHKLAEDKATEEVDDAWGSCVCHGAGCRRCREDEQ